MSTILLNDTAFDATQAPAHQSLLDFVRSTAGLTGTKEGCASGDCGACTLILRDTDGSNPISLNSCITPVGAAIGKQVITVEGVGTLQQMHPVQQALVDHHGSQCGFCTPGFVMSLVAAQLRQDTVATDYTAADTSKKDSPRTERDAAITSISGNLCRCTGYRPIVDAALAANNTPVDEPSGLSPTVSPAATSDQSVAQNRSYIRPTTLADALGQLKSQDAQRTLGAQQNPANWLLAGATDAFLEVSQHYLDPRAIIDLSDVFELKSISRANDGGLNLGAALSHAEALEFFSQADSRCDAIVSVLKRFGSPQIRNRGTLGGNIANASPIADWPPLLMALNASVVVVNLSGEERLIALDEFYLGYKSTQLAPLELIKSVQIPAAAELSALRAHKISKRFEDDISSALGAFYLQTENGEVCECRIAFGGVGPTPLRCTNTEKALLGQVLNNKLIDSTVATLATEITPISDVRASENYRREVSKALLRETLNELLETNSANRS